MLDRDVNLANEYTHLGVVEEQLSPTGLRTSPFAIGCPLLWAPFFVAAQVAGTVLRMVGFDVPGDGYGPIDQAAACYATLFYGGVAFVLVRRLGRRCAIAGESRLDLALVAMWWATPAIYYLSAEPSMTHGVTLFTITLFFTVWFPVPAARSPRGWFVLGMVGGLAALVRWQDAVVLALPLAEWLVCARARRRIGASGDGTAFAGGALLLLGFAIAILPQLAMWNAIYGRPFVLPQGNDFMQWNRPHLADSLFSTRHGLFSWHPIFMLALGSIPLLVRRQRTLAWGIVGLFALTWYVNSAVTRWWADDAFGGRRYLGLVPVLGLALAAGIDGPLKRGARARHTIVLLLVALIGWNGLCALQYRLGVVSRNQALTLRQMTIDRLRLPVDLVLRRRERGRR